jgi:hypothetical protein
MSSILTIIAKGNTKSDIQKNFKIIDEIFNNINIYFTLFSEEELNPRIYYSAKTIESKNILNLIHQLKSDKNVNYTIKQIAYASHLNII